MQFAQQYPQQLPNSQTIYPNYPNNQTIYPNYQQNYQSQPIQQNQANGDFVVVPSEDDVIRWAVAPGSVVTFRIEGQPIVIEKSMGYSKFESPHYDRYKLIKEEMVPELTKPVTDLSKYEERLNALAKDVDGLREQIGELATKKPGRTKKEESDE